MCGYADLSKKTCSCWNAYTYTCRHVFLNGLGCPHMDLMQNKIRYSNYLDLCGSIYRELSNVILANLRLLKLNVICVSSWPRSRQPDWKKVILYWQKHYKMSMVWLTAAIFFENGLQSKIHEIKNRPGFYKEQRRQPCTVFHKHFNLRGLHQC